MVMVMAMAMAMVMVMVMVMVVLTEWVMVTGSLWLTVAIRCCGVTAAVCVVIAGWATLMCPNVCCISQISSWCQLYLGVSMEPRQCEGRSRPDLSLTQHDA